MKYKSFKITLKSNDFDIIEKEGSELEIKNELTSIENELIKIILKEQEGKLGIKKIGNQIRNNEIITNVFESKYESYSIIKFFENQRSFGAVLFKALNDNMESNKTIYFLILDKYFNKVGKLVDGSAIDFQGIKEYLNKQYNVYQLKRNFNVVFLEICGFDNYIFVDKEGYAKLIYNG